MSCGFPLTHPVYPVYVDLFAFTCKGEKELVNGELK